MLISFLIMVAALLACTIVLQIVLVARIRHKETPGLGELLAGLAAGQAKAESQILTAVAASDRIERSVREELTAERAANAQSAKDTRVELTATVNQLQETIIQRISEMSTAQKAQLGVFSQQLLALTDSNERRLQEMRTTIEAKLAQMQNDSAAKLTDMRSTLDAKLQTTINSATEGRRESNEALQQFREALVAQLGEVAAMQKTQLELFAAQLANLTQSNDKRIEALRATIEGRLASLQTENSKKLDEMRATVDERLQSTLERRLSDSFKLVSERLETVQRGLGEMQSLAANVGDLKKVLANVRVRGGWGEVQLGNLLDQMLTREQYAVNVATRKGSNERVEFAIRLPGHEENREAVVLLPIDAKFPMEDYQRLVDASENADVTGIETASQVLEGHIKSLARDIRDKYINPPETTDFALMFLPVEGLYAEVLRRPGFAELLQREFRVVVTGPTTLTAILNALQMGFRTLAIEKRSSEVWQVLGAIKTEFGKFGDVLGKVHKKLQEASNQIESAESKTRVIQRKLRGVQELPANDASALLALSGPNEQLAEDSEASGSAKDIS